MNVHDMMDDSECGRIASPTVREQSAAYISVDAGKHALAMTLCAIICGVCLAVSVSAIVYAVTREREVNNKLQISENHWRDIEVRVKHLEESSNERR